MPERVMKGQGIVTNPLDWNRGELADWVERLLRFACRLPTKSPG